MMNSNVSYMKSNLDGQIIRCEAANRNQRAGGGAQGIKESIKGIKGIKIKITLLYIHNSRKPENLKYN